MRLKAITLLILPTILVGCSDSPSTTYQSRVGVDATAGSIAGTAVYAATKSERKAAVGAVLGIAGAELGQMSKREREKKAFTLGYDYGESNSIKALAQYAEDAQTINTSKTTTGTTCLMLKRDETNDNGQVINTTTVQLPVSK
jgi:hypothetical protein